MTGEPAYLADIADGEVFTAAGQGLDRAEALFRWRTMRALLLAAAPPERWPAAIRPASLDAARADFAALEAALAALEWLD